VTREPVAVPLHTGSSPVSVRLYGPGGQQVETQLLYQTPTTLLQKGRFEYSASLGKCAGNVCTRYGQFDARYAHWTRLTLGAGTEYLADSTGSAVRPYALGSFTTGTFMTGELQLMPGAVYRGSFEVFPRESATGTFTAGLSMPKFGRVSVLPDSRSRWDFDAAYDQRLPTAIGPFRSLRAGAGGQAQTDGSQSRMHLSIGSSLSAGYTELRWESGDIADDMLSARGSMLLQNVKLPLNIHPLVDGGFGLTHDGISLLHAGVAAQNDKYGSGSLGIEWARGSAAPRFTLSWSRTFRGVQAVARGVADGDHNATSTLSLRGAVSVSPNGDVATGAFAREGYGGIYGTVFLDRDGNGVFSKGDETVPGATVIIGDTHVTADDNGRYHAWSLLPYAAVRISLDSTDAGNVDPGWVTATQRLLARPVPNTSIRMDVALLETRELAGTIRTAEGVATAAGITFELVPADGGPTVTTTTFSDGQFYVSRLHPGRYTGRVSKSSLDALHATADPATVQIDVPATGNLELITVPDITLKPIPPGGN
jgi:outer membrane usher protein FimD/PapC